ncbi:MAG: matrixin family metalloprotease [Gaiellales bacterium]
MTNMSSFVRVLATICLPFVLVITFVGTASAHYTSDHRTNLYTWHTSSNIPSSWDQALMNGVLGWDNVTNQCHDFVRVATGAGQIPQWRGTIDGAGQQTIYAITTFNHNNIEYDTAEPWHLNTGTSPGGSSLDLWSVAAHENGHTLALIHSSTSAETMFATYGYGRSDWRTLESGDRTRIRALYPPGSC